jgi:hypothetical protein
VGRRTVLHARDEEEAMEAEKTTDMTRRNGLDLAVLQVAVDELGD